MCAYTFERLIGSSRSHSQEARISGSEPLLPGHDRFIFEVITPKNDFHPHSGRRLPKEFMSDQYPYNQYIYADRYI